MLKFGTAADFWAEFRKNRVCGMAMITTVQQHILQQQQDISDASGRLNSLAGEESAALAREAKLASVGCTPGLSMMFG